MLDSEETIDYLEKQIPSLCAAAVDVAYWRVLAAGRTVLISDQGGVYEVFPNGARRLIKTVGRPLDVPVGTRVQIS